MVLVYMGIRYHINVVQPPGAEVFHERNPAGGTILVFLLLYAPSVDDHDKAAAGTGRVRAFQQDGFPITHIYKG